MNIIKLDLNDKNMMEKLMPLYFNYECEITNSTFEEIFSIDKPDENIKYFIDYFNRGIDTHILIDNDIVLGFISFNIDSIEVPGYAQNFLGWGHLAEIYIDKEYRKRGLAKSLVNRFESEMIKQDIQNLYLVDIANNHLLWTKLNFTNTNIVEPSEEGIIFIKKL